MRCSKAAQPLLGAEGDDRAGTGPRGPAWLPKAAAWGAGALRLPSLPAPKTTAKEDLEGADLKPFKINYLQGGVRTPAVSGGADTSCVRGLSRMLTCVSLFRIFFLS